MPQDDQPLRVDRIQAGNAVTSGQIHAGRDINVGLTPAAPPLSSNIPPRPEHFIDRPEHLEEIHARLSARVSEGRAALIAARGDGGQGKTLLAHEYARKHAGDYPGGCFLVSVENKTLLTGLAGLCPVAAGTDQLPDTARARAVRDRLNDGEPSLLIVDSVQSVEHWQKIHDQRFPCPVDSGQVPVDSDVSVLPGGKCRVLVTTLAESLPRCESIPIGRLDEDQGAALLAKFREDAADASNIEHARAIVNQVEGLAALVAAAGAKMNLSPGLAWGDYRERLDKYELHEYPDALVGVGERVRAETGYSRTAIEVLAGLVESLHEAERRAIEYAAILPQDAIFPFWLAWLLDKDAENGLELGMDAGGEPRRPLDVVVHLLKLDILRPYRGAEDDGTAGKDAVMLLSMHNLHRKFTEARLRADSAQQSTRLSQVCKLACNRGPGSHAAVIKTVLRFELTPLVELSRLLKAHGRIEEACGLANWLHTPLRKLARFVEGRTLLEEFAESEWLGRLPAEVSGALLSNLAGILLDLGDLAGARFRMEQAIAIDENRLEPDHPAWAASYSNLAVVLHHLGDFPGARSRMEQAIAIGEQHFEVDHPNLAVFYSNLATILKDLGDLGSARDRTVQAIAIEEKRFEVDHPNLAVSYSNLAMILKGLGDLPGARAWIEQVIAIEEKHFEPDHPALVTTYSNLATILKELGDLRGARARMEQAISIGEKHFVPEHPALANGYFNLACIELAEGEGEKACALWNRSLGILQKQFSDSHPHVRLVQAALDKHCRE